MDVYTIYADPIEGTNPYEFIEKMNGRAKAKLLYYMKFDPKDQLEYIKTFLTGKCFHP